MFNTICLASHNAGKLKEFQRLFESSNVTVTNASAYNIESPEETGLTFIENAILKARHSAKISGLPSIGDDSGLEIDALNGEPGIYSARYAGEHGNADANNEKVLNAMHSQTNRSARFHCVLALLRHEGDPAPVIAHGIWQGEILTAPRGEGGFGYDPIFYVPTHQCSAAELTPELKNQLSHRGQALRQLLQRL